MDREEAKRRLLDIERCTPIHTREDARDFEALETAIKALSAIEDIKAEIDRLPSYVARFNGGDFAIHIDKEGVLQIINKHISGKESK